MYREMYGAKNYVRSRSVDNVIQELNQYIARNPDTRWIEINDDVFGVNMDWAEEFAERYGTEIGAGP